MYFKKVKDFANFLSLIVVPRFLTELEPEALRVPWKHTSHLVPLLPGLVKLRAGKSDHFSNMGYPCLTMSLTFSVDHEAEAATFNALSK